MQLDNPVATVLPKATGISWPFASWVTYRVFEASLAGETGILGSCPS